MQKGKTVKRIGFLFIMLITFISCEKEQQNDDQILLELILKQTEKQFSEAIYLYPEGNSKYINDFFRLRNKKERVFTFAQEGNDSIAELDTLSTKKRMPIYSYREITSNEYLMNGKGIDEKVEFFLKDSFNYQKERIVKWAVPESIDAALFKKQDDENYSISVAAPVYNLNKDKAIITVFHRSSKNTAQRSIYFIKKSNNSWNIIYSEKSDMFIDLKIE